MDKRDKAIRAMFAWFWCEQNGGAENISCAARTELCNYTEHLCQEVIDEKESEYEGIPRLYLHGLEKATREECEALVDEVFALLKQKKAA